MYPRTLDESELKSKAEKRVFNALEEQLDDEWECFHSASWLIKDPDEGAEDGEIDFVIAHPDRGILCLEVKGGGIECRGGQWFRVYQGDSQKIKDPFSQALDHRYDLERKIKAVEGWSSRKPMVIHGLALPYITIPKLDLAPDAPREILIDRHGMENVGAAIDQVLEFHGGAREKRNPPGEEGMRMLRELLAPDIRIEVPLAAEFVEEEAQLVTLTHDQARLLNNVARAPRVVVRGCAGSGKTMIAVERAKRLAKDGADVGFICFNRALRDHLRDREAGSGVHFNTFHGLCFHLSNKAKLKIARYPQDKAPPEYWDEVLPEALVDAVDEENLGPQFDALFVDEAQDLHNHWLDALASTLRDPVKGTLWLFMDDNQRVYDSSLDVPDDFFPFDLSVNCRNTQAIGNEVLKKYEGDVKPSILGPPGREVELLQTEDQIATVDAVIERLCQKEEVPPQDIVVLSSHSLEGSKVGRSGGDKFRFTKKFMPLGDYVRFSSIRGYKGLESPVVVLCELEDIEDETTDQQLYVGISRAKNHCVWVAPK